MTNVVQFLQKAEQLAQGERVDDKHERRRLACLIVAAVGGVLLFGALCFDLGFRVAAALYG